MRAWSHGVAHEVRLAIRTLLRAPRFTIAAVAILAAALGAATSVFTVVSGVLLEPLPYREPDRLVRIIASKGEGFLSGPELSEYRDRGRAFDGVAGANTFAAKGADLTGRGQPVRVTVLPVTAGYFEVLGARAAFGRTFARQDERAGAPEIVLSERLAARLGDPRSIVGSVVRLDGLPATVVGVMAAGFRDPFDSEAEAWKPAAIGTSYGNRYLRAIGRLAVGTSAEAATAELTTLTSGLIQRRPTAYRDWSVRVVNLQDTIAGDVRRLLTVLLAFVVLVLVLASANVAQSGCRQGSRAGPRARGPRRAGRPSRPAVPAGGYRRPGARHGQRGGRGPARGSRRTADRQPSTGGVASPRCRDVQLEGLAVECRLSPRGGHRIEPSRQLAGGPVRSGAPSSDWGSDVDARRQAPSSPRQPRRVPGGDCLCGAVDGRTAGRELRQTLGSRPGFPDGRGHHLQDWLACGAVSDRRRPSGVPSATRRQPRRHSRRHQRGHGVQTTGQRRLPHLELPG